MDSQIPSRKRSSSRKNFPNGSHKRSKRPPQPLTVPVGHVVFRLLCNISRVGGIIGKSGSVIKQIRKDTGAMIRVDDALPNSEDRVIVVIASAELSCTIDQAEASSAQDALIRVFEKILDIAAETDEAFAKYNGVVSCRLLIEKSQVGSLIGKGGKIIESMRIDSGSKIRVLSGDKVPSCAGANDEMVEIEGDILSVKKGLVAVSRRLQDYPPSEKTKLMGSRSQDSFPHETLSDPHLNFPQQNTISNPVIFNPVGHPLSLKSVRFPAPDNKTVHHEMVFKILCSNDTVGGVIGKGGSIVQALQNETRATISVGPSVDECNERLITILATENPESRRSAAQDAVVLVFARSVEASIERGLDLGSNKAPEVSARLVVPSSQVGCLLGKGGHIISEIRRLTGASIQISGIDKVPNCAPKNVEVVQISGQFLSVQDALCYVTSRLRDNFFMSMEDSGPGARSNSFVLPDVGQYGMTHDVSNPGLPACLPNSYGLVQNVDHHGLPYNLEYSSSSRLWSSQAATGLQSRGTTDVGIGLAFNGGLLGSGSKSAVVTNTTVEIVVPQNVISSVYGENGSNLTRLRQISGAKVIVHEPHPGTNDRVIVISGTPDETQAAQSLLQAFILTGSS